MTCDNIAVLTVAVLGQLRVRRDGEAIRVPAGPAHRLLDTAKAQGDVDAQVLALDAFAALRASAGDPEPARTFLAAADELMPVTTHRLADVDRRDARRARALLSPS